VSPYPDSCGVQQEELFLLSVKFSGLRHADEMEVRIETVDLDRIVDVVLVEPSPSLYA